MAAALAACNPGSATADHARDNQPAQGVETPRAEGREISSSTPQAAAVLTADGYGPLRIGMSAAEVEAAMGPDDDPANANSDTPETCDQWRPARAPADMMVMIEDGRLTRISVFGESTVRTDRGVGVGANAAEVKSIYGDNLESDEDPFEPGVGYLTVWKDGRPPTDGDESARGVRYSVGEDGAVTSIRVGSPSILYEEGCL